MVILIGGSSHVGKTLVARRLVAKYGYDCIPLDFLKEAFQRSGIGNPGDRDDYQMRYWMWPFVVQIIKKAVASDRSLILEGCYIPAEWAQSFTKGELGNIRCVFLVMSEGHLRTRFDEVKEHAQDAELRGTEPLDLWRLINCSAEFREQCIGTGTYYIEIDGAYDLDSICDAVEAVIEDPDPAERGIVL